MQRRYHRRTPPKPLFKAFRTNKQINAKEVRLIDENDQNVGVISLPDALKRADEASLDLVEVSPLANPPVARIMNYGSFKYEQEKKAKKQKALQKKTEVKGVRLSFHIKGEDLDMRRQQALRFLADGHHVKIELMLRGRERAHRDKARELLKQFLDSLDNIAYLRPMESQGSRLSVEITKKS